MKYRRLGKTGLVVSVVGVGTWQLSGEWGRRFTQPEVDRLLGRAHEVGVNLIDTAECYGDHLAEVLIGGAIHRHRNDWVVATKFGHRFHPEALHNSGGSPTQLRSEHWSPAEVVTQLEASLRALRTDHVDLYQMHSGPMRSLTVTRCGRRSASRSPRVRSATWACPWAVTMSIRPGASIRSAPGWSRLATTAWTAAPSKGSCRRAWIRT
jgi:aryl-alcohol dehydrogenase-like predicted oxidoreductase